MLRATLQAKQLIEPKMLRLLRQGRDTVKQGLLWDQLKVCSADQRSSIYQVARGKYSNISGP